jgi:small subunit ribosomal protein S8
MTDVIADFIVRIKNGQLAKKGAVFVRKSKYSLVILEILEREGFIRGYKFSAGRPYEIAVLLKYHKGKPVIRKFKKISKKSSPIFISSYVLWRLNKGIGLFIVSTSKGVMTDKSARQHRLGGEVVAYIE